MKLQKLSIKNFKSLVDVELVNPNPFTVFIGPNAAGKSNIFEALEYFNLSVSGIPEVEKLFGGSKAVLNTSLNVREIDLAFEFEDFETSISSSHRLNLKNFSILDTYVILFGKNIYPSLEALNKAEDFKGDKETYKQFFFNFSRLFINKKELVKLNYKDAERLRIDAGNLEKVLKRVLMDEMIREELLEWLDLLVPELSNIEIHSDNISGIDTLLVYEKYSQKPFTKNLISDGTYNILALLTAIYQSDEPQFLCIEEPENGLNPLVARELANIFRQICEEKGHYIWLNTHSQSLVAALRPEEVVLVDKVKGATQLKQLAGTNLHGLRMDEAWFTNTLGGGLPY